MRSLNILAVAVAGLAPAAHAADPVLTSGFVESGGEQIYFETTGSGEALVLCHGLGGNHAIWYQQVPVFAQRHTVVTWSWRSAVKNPPSIGQAFSGQLASPSFLAEEKLRPESAEAARYKSRFPSHRFRHITYSCPWSPHVAVGWQHSHTVPLGDR